MNPDDRWDDEVRDAYHRPIEGEAQARERAIARLRREARARRSRMGAWWVDPDVLRVRPLVFAASLLAVLVIGAWVRHFFSLRHAGRTVWAIPVTAAIAIAVLAIVIRPQSESAAGTTPVPFARVAQIVDTFMAAER